MTKKEIQDITLKAIGTSLADTVTIRERITDKFTEWFQKLIEIPKPEAKDQKQSGGGGGRGGGGGGGGDAAAPAGA